MYVVRVSRFLVPLFALLGVCQTVSGQPLPADQATVLAAQAEQRIRELQAEADRLAAETSTLLGSLRKLELEREISAQAVRKADAEMTVVNGELARSQTRVATLESQRLAETAGVSERLVEIYKRGRGGYVRLLFAADDLRALGRLTRAVAAVARLDQLRFDEHRRTIRAEREALAEVEQRKVAATAAQAEAIRARRALDAAVASHNQRLDQLDRRRDLAAQYVGELRAAATALDERMAGTTSGQPPALPIEPFRGTLEWPVPGRIVSRFGRQTASRTSAVVQRNGLEIATTAGQPVRVVHGGTIAFAAPFVGFGNLVIVDHGGNAFTLYGHLQEVTAPQGARVERGAVVGRAGRNPEGVEVLYFEVRIDGQAVDPVQWLRAAR